jgi:hypothetical protein
MMGMSAQGKKTAIDATQVEAERILRSLKTTPTALEPTP